MIATLHYDSPIGCLAVTGTDARLYSVRRVDGPSALPDHPTPLLREAVRQLRSYFDSQRLHFDLPLDYQSATDFQRRVWELLRAIPYGQTRSYLHIAQQLGDAKAVRAVGMANRTNPFAIVVPCHRVIAANGDLQGYFYGLDVKRQLLALENPASFAEQGSLF